MRHDLVWAVVYCYLVTEFNYFKRFSPAVDRVWHPAPLSAYDLNRHPTFHQRASQAFHPMTGQMARSILYLWITSDIKTQTSIYKDR